MKVHQILEGRYGGGLSSIPVTVEYEMEVQNPQAEGGWDVLNLVVSGAVSAERDPFGTGDSPTEFSFEPETVINKDTGQPIDPKTIGSDDWEHIDNMACNQAMGSTRR